MPQRSVFMAQHRVGRVQSVSKSAHTVKVHFEDADEGFVSPDFPVLVTRPGDYALPAVDSLVLCAIMDSDEGVGWVLGAFYSESDEPPLDDEGQRSIAGDDVRLGDPEAEKKIVLDGDGGDGGTLLLTVGGGATLAWQYTDPSGGITSGASGAPIALKIKSDASAEKVSGS